MASNDQSTQLMKDGLNSAAILRIGKNLQQVIPGFNANKFHKQALIGLDQLELKQRVHHVITHLHLHCDLPFKKLCRYLQQLPATWDSGNSADNKAMFAAWPIIDYVAIHGLEHPKEALQTLEKITHLFSAEFAIRPFIQHHYQLAYPQLLKWCEHSSEHVRRLASEGSRPRLPWGIRLQDFIRDPSPLTPILMSLKQDESLYVRRSVANNINDISKDNPDWAIDTCEKFLNDGNERSDWIVKHALRSLVKAGNPRVFPLLGYSKNAKFHLQDFRLKSKKVRIGKDLEFSFTLMGDKQDHNLVVDYLIYFARANGKNSGKVFKLKNIELKKNQQIFFQKKHSFKPITTRVYYPGWHQIAIQINGREVVREEFLLV